MDLTQLEMFNAVALTGSITTVRRRRCIALRLTSPPASASLEADLGVELFIRESQRLRYLPPGTTFCATVSRSRWLTRRGWSSPVMSRRGYLPLAPREHRRRADPESLAAFNQRYPRIQFALYRPVRNDD